MPLGFPVEGFASGMSYQPRRGDVFVCTYPKCGTTWVQYIVYLMVRRRPLDSSESLSDVFPHLEEVGAEAVGDLPEPRLIKTHLPRTMTPFAENARYIVVARNPFDCVVSFYYHTRGFPRHYRFTDGRFEDFFECFIEGRVDFGDYFDHLLSWHQVRHERNVHFLTYEALKRNTATEIARLASFLGGEIAQLAADEEALARVVEESSFESMRRDQQRWSSRRPSELPFVRKGKVGSWTDIMTAEQAGRLLEKLEERAAGTDIVQLWPDTIETARRRTSGEVGPRQSTKE